MRRLSSCAWISGCPLLTRSPERVIARRVEGGCAGAVEAYLIVRAAGVRMKRLAVEAAAAGDKLGAVADQERAIGGAGIAIVRLTGAAVGSALSAAVANLAGFARFRAIRCRLASCYCHPGSADAQPPWRPKPHRYRRRASLCRLHAWQEALYGWRPT